MRWWWQIIVDDVLLSLWAVVSGLHVLSDRLEKALRHWRSVWKWNSWLLSARCWEVKRLLLMRLTRGVSLSN